MRTIVPILIAGTVIASGSCAGRPDSSPIAASGHVEATEIRLATKVAGRIDAMPVAEGDRVTAGEVVARLQTVDLDLALAQARAERGQALAELDLRLAGARKEEIAEARARVASLEADLAGAERELERMQSLLDKGSGVEKARDDAKTGRDVVAGRLEAARQILARLASGSRREEIEAARSRLAATEARVDQIAQQIADAAVVSPIDAVLTERIVEPGEWVAVGSVVAVLTDLANPWLTVWVEEPHLGRVRFGQEAEVSTDDGSRRTGRVTYIASQAEFTPKNVQTRDERAKLVFKVKIGLDNEDGIFKPGMPGEARFSTGAAR